MAVKKTKKKKSGKTKKKKLSVKRELIKILTGIVVLVFIVASLAMVADYLIYSGSGEKIAGRQKEKSTFQTAAPSKEGAAGLKEKPSKTKSPVTTGVESGKETVFEVFDDTKPFEKTLRKIIPGPMDEVPKVAIIMDDLGFDKKQALELAFLESGITFSILPGATFSRSIAEDIHKMGGQIMLHLPMEPMEYPEIDPGFGAILAAMSPDELIDQLRRDLDAFPHISGVNNHMGSRVTTLSPQMNQVFTVLKQRHLFFIDSRTSKDTLCRSSARLLQVPFGQRDVFLDNIQDPDYIRGQIAELIKTAKRHGTAIGIGHPYGATISTLKAELPNLKKKVRIVPASTLAAIPG